MKKMYFLKDRKEAVIDRLTYMSKHRQEYLQDKEHGMITLQFKQGMPVIRFSSGRVTSYWDFSFDGKKMTVQRRCSLSDKIIWGTLLIIDLFILYLFRQSIWLGLAWFCALLLLEVLPFYALESCVTFRHVKMFVTHYLADYIGESEEIYEMKKLMKGLCLILALFILVCDCGIEIYADAWDGRSETTLCGVRF